MFLNFIVFLWSCFIDVVLNIVPVYALMASLWRLICDWSKNVQYLDGHTLASGLLTLITSIRGLPDVSASGICSTDGPFPTITIALFIPIP